MTNPQQHRVEVAIVGGGLAGLTAAYRLSGRGIDTALYEATERLGGRVLTDRVTFPGHVFERGGEFIASDHKRILALAREFEIPLYDLHFDRQESLTPRFVVGGETYDPSDVERDLAPVAEAAERDRPRRSRPIGLKGSPRQLDEMSALEWIETRIPGGLTSRLGRLVTIAVIVEYGATPDDLSAMDVWSMLAGDGPVIPQRLWGASDDRYRVRGGNDYLVEGLSARVPRIYSGHRLRALVAEEDAVLLRCLSDGGEVGVRARHVVLAIPFSTLRLVDLDGANLSEAKRAAIRELGMGIHVKVHCLFAGRPWTRSGANGDCMSDASYQCTWESSSAASSDSAVLVAYLGAISVIRHADVTQMIAALDRVFPGAAEAWDGRVIVDAWNASSVAGGSYAYYRVGQHTRFGPVIARPEGRVHFAGEHTSGEYQGYMEGAVESGERAAEEVAQALSKRRTA